MPKKQKKQVVKCEKCDREFKDDQALEYPGKVYVHKGTVLCKDCLIEMGVLPDSAQPYSVYMRTIADMGKLGPGAGGI